ncbi:MAG: ATP-dependent DNA ligase, partial [Proteobacteria bacterium]
MRKFAELYESIDATTSTNDKVDAMAEYFQSATSADSAWALYYLTGRRLKRFISSRSLRDWTLELTQVREWLYDECYSSVGDTAEVCSLLLDSYDLDQVDRSNTPEYNLSLDEWMTNRIKPLAKADEQTQKETVVDWWTKLDRHGIFVLNKLLTGSFRVGVSQSLVARALAKITKHEVAEISHRLMGNWEPTPEWFEQLTSAEAATHSLSTPYPFYLASPI